MTQSRLNRRDIIGSGIAAGLFAATSLPAHASPKRGGVLRLVLPSEPRAIEDQILASGLLFQQLTQVLPNGALAPELATRWRADKSAKIWTFDLREDVSFHNGSIMSADTAITAFRTGGFAQKRQGFSNGIVAVRKNGPFGLTFELNRADPDFPYRLASPEFSVQGPQPLVGTGLYRHLESAPERMMFERVNRHWKGEACGWFDRLEVLTSGSQDARREALEIGRVDVAVDIGADFLAPKSRLEIAPFALSTAVDPTLDARKIFVGISKRIQRPHTEDQLPAQHQFRWAERWWRA